ncbi:MAG: hypothetical protein IKP68_08925 [Clostridia bacterium]|nr:hypothetical protein [Clostridia bacterium]
MKFNYFDMLSGDPIFVDGIGHFRSPVLKELCPRSGLGYNTYNLYLSFLSWDKEKILQYDRLLGLRGVDRLAAEERLTAFDVITLLEQTREFCREVLAFFLLEDISWDSARRKYVATTSDDEGQHLSGEIGRNNFENVRKTILQMNFIGVNDDTDESKTKFSNERAKELWEKAQNFAKKQSKENEKEDRPEYHIGNIVSKLCAIHPTYNLLNVWDLTVFQLYDAFFQISYMRFSDLNEKIFSAHGGDKFKFEDWLKPILEHV